MKSITIVHRYFWPQNYPYAQMLKDIAIAAKETGLRVKVLSTSTGDIEEKTLRAEFESDTGIQISTINLGSEKNNSLLRKAFNAAYFSVSVLFHLLRAKTDIVMVATTPPILCAAMVRWISHIKGYKYIYHCQDIHPEAMLLGGNIKEGIFYKLLRAIDKKNINSASNVITLSTDMEKTYQERGCNINNFSIINNYIFRDFEDFKRNESASKIKFLFAGSMGRLQNLENLFFAINNFSNRDDVEFIFIGSGVMLPKLQQMAEEQAMENITFLGQRPLAETMEYMQACDYGIVSLSQGIASVAYPSKSIMYWGAGLPILGLLDQATDMSQFIEDEKLGATASPDNIESIKLAIEYLIVNRSSYSKSKIIGFAQSNFSKDIILNKFKKVFQSV